MFSGLSFSSFFNTSWNFHNSCQIRCFLSTMLMSFVGNSRFPKCFLIRQNVLKISDVDNWGMACACISGVARRVSRDRYQLGSGVRGFQCNFHDMGSSMFFIASMKVRSIERRKALAARAQWFDEFIERT